MRPAFPDDPRFAAGAREFNAGNFYEAHEIWEDLWNDLIGEPKQLCQGMIQVAVGYHKLAIANGAGARKLLERGLRLLRASGVASEIANAIEADLGHVQAAEEVQPPTIEVK